MQQEHQGTIAGEVGEYRGRLRVISYEV